MLSSIGCADGSAVVHDMLISAMSAKQVAESRGMTGLGWEKFYRMRFLECLGTLAVTHGAKGASGAHTQPRRFFPAALRPRRRLGRLDHRAAIFYAGLVVRIIRAGRALISRRLLR